MAISLHLFRSPKLLGVYSRLAWQLYRTHGAKAVFSKGKQFLLRQRNTVAYGEWIASIAPYLARRADQLLAAGPDGPKISLVMPVCDVDESWLVAAIESVRKQRYPNWELCIADDHSKRPHVRPVLERFAAQDPRIKVVFREERGHISKASNSALALATGEFIGLLDHDDELLPTSLLEVVHAIRRQPTVDILYTDEDKIDERGRRFSPHFKPELNRELLYGQNYVCHFLVLRASLVREVGGFRPGYEGSQDYDLLLRTLEKTTDDRVHHIPLILYHWRAIPGSTALGRSQKDYGYAAGVRALQEHFDRTFVAAEALPGTFPCHRVKYALPRPAPKVTIIIPTKDRADLVSVVADGILNRTDYPDFELIIVDNQSREEKTFALLRSLQSDPRVRVLPYPHEYNFSRINNQAAKVATGELLLFLNNDIEISHPEWLAEMVSTLCRDSVGAVGAKLLYASRRIQHAGITLGLGDGAVAGHPFLGFHRRDEGYFRRLWCAHEVSAVTAACLLTKRALFENVGGFEDTNLPIAYSDVDLCLKIRALGLRVVWTPFAELIHHESLSRGHDAADEKKRARFLREQDWMRNRWKAALQNDPSYNPNLSLQSSAFELAYPPRLEAL